MREYGMPVSVRFLGVLALMLYLGAVALPVLWYIDRIELDIPMMAGSAVGCLVVGALFHGLSSLIRTIERGVRAIERSGVSMRMIQEEPHDTNATLTETSLSDEEVFGRLYKGVAGRGKGL